MTPLSKPTEAVSTLCVVITCAGTCKHVRTQVAQWTRHIFIRVDPIARALAVIYACTRCGTERRYGLIGVNEGAD